VDMHLVLALLRGQRQAEPWSLGTRQCSQWSPYPDSKIKQKQKQCKEQYKRYLKPGVVVHAFNPSTQEAEAGRFLSLRPAWSTKWVPGQHGLYRETLSRKTKKKKKKKDIWYEPLAYSLSLFLTHTHTPAYTQIHTHTRILNHLVFYF
jgi:hypothetical protein